MIKTNAMRLLKQAGVPFDTTEYEWNEEDFSGVHTAALIGMPAEQVFKTLVARGDKTGPLVFCIPVKEDLDLRRAAAASANKRVELIHVRELVGLTGYVRGGCSPIGMKKKFPAYFDETAILFDKIVISAGIRGEQIVIEPNVLMAFLSAETAALTAD